MKLVHTTYFLTTLLFLVIASYILMEQPVPEHLLTSEKNKSSNINQFNIQELQDQADLVRPSPQDPLAGLPRYEVVATGYYAGVDSTGKDEGHPQYGITYSGAKVVRDHYSTIAADLNLFPLGTILYIPGYGYGVVADIGSAIKGNIIDLYFDTREDVFTQWGKKTIDVFLVKRGEGLVTDAMLEQLNSKQVVQANVPIE